MLLLADGFFSFADNITLIPAILLILGTSLFVVEMCIPGFGFFGVSGIICYLISILLTAKTFVEFLSMLVILLAVLAILTTIMLVLLGKGKLPSKIVLKESIDGVSNSVSGTEDINYYIGMTGTAVSTLRPSGTCEINGVKLDVVTDGEFIEIGTPVIVTKVVEGHIIVKSDK